MPRIKPRFYYYLQNLHEIPMNDQYHDLRCNTTIYILNHTAILWQRHILNHTARLWLNTMQFLKLINNNKNIIYFGIYAMIIYSWCTFYIWSYTQFTVLVTPLRQGPVELFPEKIIEIKPKRVSDYLEKIWIPSCL